MSHVIQASISDYLWMDLLPPYAVLPALSEVCIDFLINRIDNAIINLVKDFDDDRSDNSELILEKSRRVSSNAHLRFRISLQLRFWNDLFLFLDTKHCICVQNLIFSGLNHFWAQKIRTKKNKDMKNFRLFPC